MVESAPPAEPLEASVGTGGSEAQRAEDREDRALLRRLLRGQRELRADFDVLERCFDRHDPAVADDLRRERFKRAQHRSGWVASKVKLGDILLLGELAHRVLSGVRLVSAMQRASRSMQHIAEANTQDQVLVAGGTGRHFGSTDDVLRTAEGLHLGGRSWEPIPSLNLKRMGHTGAVLGGHFYVCGGWSPLGRSVARYDPVRQRWTILPSMNTKRVQAAAVAVRDRLYVFGGQSESDTWSSAECFRPGGGGAANTPEWVGAPHMLYRRRALAAAVLGDTVLISGGVASVSGHEGIEDRMAACSAEALELPEGTTKSLPDMATFRAHHAAAVAGGKLYLAGGFVPGTRDTLTSVEVYDPIAEAWSELTSSPMPRPRWAHVAVASGGGLLVLGGYQQVARGAATEPSEPSEASVDRLDLATGSWEQLPSMGVGRAAFCAGVVALGPMEAGAPRSPRRGDSRRGLPSPLAPVSSA